MLRNIASKIKLNLKKTQIMVKEKLTTTRTRAIRLTWTPFRLKVRPNDDGTTTIKLVNPENETIREIAIPSEKTQLLLGMMASEPVANTPEERTPTGRLKFAERMLNS